MNKLAVKFITLYQLFSRNIFQYGAGFFISQSSCKFYPSCSDYAIESFKRYNFFKAFFKSSARIIRCNPFSKTRVDMP